MRTIGVPAPIRRPRRCFEFPGTTEGGTMTAYSGPDFDLAVEQVLTIRGLLS